MSGLAQPGPRQGPLGALGGPGGAAMLAVFLAGTLAQGGLMGQLTQAEIDGWYRSLQAPPGTPPDWVFPVVWTPLYVLMAVAGWRVFRRAGVAALVPWFVQLALNAAWTPAFFTMNSPLLGLAVIAPFWLAIAWTIRRFRAHDRVASWLLVPYLVWVTYAAWLNLGFAWLN